MASKSPRIARVFVCILCTVCNCAVHKKCHDKVLGKCPGSAKESRETKVVIYVLTRHCLFDFRQLFFSDFVGLSAFPPVFIFITSYYFVDVVRQSKMATRLLLGTCYTGWAKKTGPFLKVYDSCI